MFFIQHYLWNNNVERTLHQLFAGSASVAWILKGPLILHGGHETVSSSGIRFYLTGVHFFPYACRYDLMVSWIGDKKIFKISQISTLKSWDPEPAFHCFGIFIMKKRTRKADWNASMFYWHTEHRLTMFYLAMIFALALSSFFFLLGKVATVVDIGAGVGQLGAWLLKNVRYT